MLRYWKQAFVASLIASVPCFSLTRAQAEDAELVQLEAPPALQSLTFSDGQSVEITIVEEEAEASSSEPTLASPAPLSEIDTTEFEPVPSETASPETTAEALTTPPETQPTEAPVADAPKPAPKAQLAPVTSQQTEVVRERYADGSIKIERHIAEDAEGNLVNHGKWTQWDEAGNIVGTGEYLQGQQSGEWVRYFAANQGKMFDAPAYETFARPFTSEATFVDGKLHGVWQVVDAEKRPVMHCNFNHGQPTGIATWWFANGQKQREVNYRHGKLDGEFLEWDSKGELATADNYIDGRKHSVKVEWHAPGQKKSEGPYLMARQVTEENYDFWNASVTAKTIGQEGSDQRHGRWTWWHQNGMKQLEGSFEEGKPHGKFVWWFSNSQKRIEGAYINGKEDGPWTWWHQNGLTQFKGDYIAGTKHGRWIGYNEDGKLLQVQEHTAANLPGYDIASDQAEAQNSSRQVRQPKAADKPTSSRVR